MDMAEINTKLTKKIYGNCSSILKDLLPASTMKNRKPLDSSSP